jgi:hypothetical protein
MNRARTTTPWPVNPLVTHIRIEATDMLQEMRQASIEAYNVPISLFDLMIQVMLVSCSYDPVRIWQGSPKEIAEVVRLLRLNATHEASELMEDLIHSGDIYLNKRLIKRIAKQQARRLVELRRQAYSDIGLPLDDEFSDFVDNSELANLRLLSLEGWENVSAEAVERHTGVIISFRQIDMTTSRTYARAMHYLHTPRDDEVVAFGAFREGEKYPFAWVTYSRAGREYKQKLLQSLGMEYDSTFELTRAWNSERAPKNTMSMLYAFAHAVLQEQYLSTTDRMGAIITAVNPNLGFIGSAFRAVGFSLVAEKPTQYHYAKDRSGSLHYITRRSAETGWHDRVVRHSAQFPLLASKELVVLLVGTKRLPALCPVRLVELADYEAG